MSDKERDILAARVVELQDDVMRARSERDEARKEVEDFRGAFRAAAQQIMSKDAELVALERQNAALRLEFDRLRKGAKELRDENYYDLLVQMREAWGMYPGQQLNVCEVEAFLMSRIVHKPTRSLREAFAASEARNE